MWNTDETIGSMMWLIETTITQIDWKHEPQKDGVKSDDPEAVRQAAFADTLLIDMNKSWQDHIEDALSMIPMGFAPCEIVLKQRKGNDSRFDDKLWGIAGLELRDQASIFNWIYDDKKLVAFRQVTYAGGAIIPMWKICNYRIKAHLDRPTGRSLFYNAYRSWRLKMAIQDSEAIGIERDLCGLPTFRMPLADIEQASRTVNGQPTPEALQALGRISAAQKAVRDMRFNRSGGLVIPSDTYDDDQGKPSAIQKYDLKIVTTAGQRSIDTRTAVRDYDRAIARTAMMQFLQLGDRAGGSNGLSDDQSTLAINALQAIANKIAGTHNRSTLPLVWRVNAMDPRYLPQLKSGNITKEGMVQIGAFLQGIGKAWELFQDDAPARVEVLKRIGITTTEKAQTYVPPPTPAPLAQLPLPLGDPPPKPAAKPAQSQEEEDNETS